MDHDAFQIRAQREFEATRQFRERLEPMMVHIEERLEKIERLLITLAQTEVSRDSGVAPTN